MPDGYGVPETAEGVLPWSFVEERLAPAKNYWIATVRPDSRPHAMPVWGAWLDGKLYIEGSPETVRHRNIRSNPQVVAHLESGDQVVIIEGEAKEVGKPPRSLGERLSEQMTAKYGPGYAPGPDTWDEGGLFEITPKKVFAWSRFPDDTTRWTFG
jgi:nitroimidazol reductase NimA-like FMN-containing flavoprotein (pyridoxamine 5'-phosphate oxidase superfamily)